MDYASSFGPVLTVEQARADFGDRLMVVRSFESGALKLGNM